MRPSHFLHQGELIVKSTRVSIIILSIAAVAVLVFVGAQLQVPTAFAFPILHFSKVHAVPGLTGQHTWTLGTNACLGSGCHVSNGSPGSAAVTGFPANMTYTPGTPIPLTVTINDSNGGRFGFELTARLASNTATAAGSWAAGTGSNLGTDVVPVVQGLSSSSTFSFTWTPPATASGSVNFYLTGWAGSFPNGDAYTAMYTLTAAAAPALSSISASPSTLTFSYQQGGAVPASQPITVSGSPSGLAYTAAASGATWLSIDSASGNVTGKVNASVNPGTLPPGTYGGGKVTITSSGATGSPQVVSVTLVITAATTTSSLTATPTSLHFSYTSGGAAPSPQNLNIGATGSTSLNFTASYSGGTWVTLKPTTGTTPGTVAVSATPGSMSSGTYNGTISISAPGATTLTVPVTLTVTGSGGSGGGTGSSMYAQPQVHDPASSGGVSAQWVDHLGDGSQTNNPGLVLLKNAYAHSGAWAGASIVNAPGSLTELGLDYLAGGQCTSTSPRFIVVMTDASSHTVGGCRAGTIQTNTPVMGWERVRYNLDRANPPITPGMQVQSITLVLDQGPGSGQGAAGGLAVIDNIDVNGTLIGGGTNSSPTPNPNPPPQPPPHDD
jgi:hypothetical protein